jgi:hypothetical protein
MSAHPSEIEEEPMAGRDRLNAVKRARERQALIEAATLRVARAQARAEQARSAKERTVATADEKIAGADDALAVEIRALVAACGSTSYAAEILCLEERRVRRLASTKTARAE